MKYLKVLLVITLSLFMIGTPSNHEDLLMNVVWSEESYVPIDMGSFDPSDYMVLQHFQSGHQEELVLSYNHFLSEELLKLHQSGEHQLSVQVEGHELILNLIIKSPVIPSIMEGLFEKGFDEGLIDITYDEWLLSIKGDPGRSILDAHVNEEGLLHLTFCDGEVTPLVNVIGPKGEDAIPIEIDIIDDHIQWRYINQDWQVLIPLSDLMGLRGLRGFSGATGAQGESIELRVHEGYLQSSYPSSDTWDNVLDLNTLKSEAGRSISDASININGDFIITYSDGTTQTAGSIPKTHTVIFVGLHGNVLDFQTVSHGGHARNVVPPIVEGYQFHDWSRAWTNITQDTLIEANYNVNQVTLTFNPLGGSNIEPITTDYGTHVDLPTPIKEGFVFKGWFYGESIHDAQFTHQSLITEHITLYARWDVEIYNVIFAVDGSIIHQTYTLFNQDVLPPENPIKAGFEFISWNQTSSAVTSDLWIEAIFEKTYLFTGVIFNTGYDQNSILLEEDEIIIKLETALERTGVLTSHGRLFIWGSNSHGQLGNNTTIDSKTPFQINSFFPENLTDDRIIDISLGRLHSIALTESGRVFTWGNNSNGRLGLGTNTANRIIPNEITSEFITLNDERLTKVFAGNDHTIVISNKGSMWSFGLHNGKYLGHSSSNVSIVWPTKINLSLEANEIMTNVYLSNTFNGFLTSQNRLFMFGENVSGQIGDGTTDVSQTPQPISLSLNDDELIIDVSLGMNHSVALTNQGNVITWGNRMRGQIGPNRVSNSQIPTKIDLDILNENETIINVMARFDTTYLLTSNNRLLVFGDNSGMYFQEDITHSSTPIDITENIFNNDYIAFNNLNIGGTSTNPFMMIHSDVEVFGIGQNDKGQLGNNSEINASILTHSYIFNRTPSIEAHLTMGTSLPVITTLEDYTFAGWYTDIELTIPFNENTMPEEDLILYAKWTKD